LKPRVSVVTCVKNGENHINKCINSILIQSFSDFEFIIIDDYSTDKTPDIVKKYDDPRIRYFRNEKWIGVSKSRNIGLHQATGEYIFFTDSDCLVQMTWIEEGLKCLETRPCVGVEGKIYYVSEDFQPTFSDHIVQNKTGGNYMTGNVAYRKLVLEKVGGFDESLNYFEDRDIALRVMKHGAIIFNPKMVAYHSRVVMTPRSFVQLATHEKYRICLFKKFGEKKFFVWRIFMPTNLIKVFFPFMIFASLFSNRFENPNDFRLLPYSYIYAVLERLSIWRTGVYEKFFVI
jgi:glycosyltransferase involved in cell wall biosynthesis